MNEIVTVKNGLPITTSRTVAEVFGKRHDNVLRDIGTLDCSQAFKSANFRVTDYTSERGKTYPQYDITLEGFARLAMGYRGTRAAQFKELFLTQFGLHTPQQALHTFLKDFDPKDLPPKLRSNTMNEIVTVKDGLPVTTSRTIAEVFGKMHKNVLQDIRDLDCSEEFLRSNFRPRDYLDSRSKTYPEYDITLEGFARLAMGYRGARAAQFKEQFLTQFSLHASQQALHAFLKDFDPKDLPKDRFIYVAQEEESKRYKVGISKNPEARIKALNAGNSESLNLVAMYKATGKGKGYESEYNIERDLTKVQEHINP